MKEGRDPLAANLATNEFTVFSEFIARGLPNFKYELNHTDSEEKIPILLFEREVYLKNHLRGYSNRKNHLNMEPTGCSAISVNNYQHMLRNSPEDQRQEVISLF
jgi:hypothetical protein